MFLWDKYFRGSGSQLVSDCDLVMCGFSRPHEDLDFWGWRFHSIGDYSDYPPQRWSDALIKVLYGIAEPQFLLLLEDYWPVRPIDRKALKMLFGYARQFQNVLKIDTAFDRLYINGGSDFHQGNRTYDNCGYLDLLLSPPGTDYQFSLWGGIWNREVMKPFVVSGETAQELELNGTRRLNEVGDRVMVLGTRQGPLLHGNIYQSRRPGEPIYEDIGWRVKPSDLERMRELKLIPMPD
jgi:hypothetical protein